MIKKYKKRPVVIEAIQYTGGLTEDILMFCPRIRRKELDLEITTLEGDMTVSINDYIIKGIQGEFYPCKPDIFEQTYEEV